MGRNGFVCTFIANTSDDDDDDDDDDRGVAENLVSVRVYFTLWVEGGGPCCILQVNGT
jgi:hypothetical protein